MNEKKLHVLLAEAYPDETASALRALYPEGRDGLELTNVSSVSTLIATFEIVNPEVIFLDLSLVQPDPLDGVRRVHRSAPLIVLADSSDKNSAVRSLSQGALDYLLKALSTPGRLNALFARRWSTTCLGVWPISCAIPSRGFTLATVFSPSGSPQWKRRRKGKARSCFCA